MKNYYRNPTKHEVYSDLFRDIWNVIREWDISTEYDKFDDGERYYSGATGNHVTAIMEVVIDNYGICPSCRSRGFEKSILGYHRCTFCDGTEGGNPPTKENS